MIDVMCGQPHYADHLAPIWLNLPGHLKGRWYATSRVARDRAEALGVGPAPGVLRRPHSGTAIVAGHSDYRRTRGRVIWVEHGAGQTYEGVNTPDYAGGPDRRRVSLFLCPGPRPAAANRASYPSAEVVEVGCPMLDHRPTGGTAVAVSFHHPSPTRCLEAGWAWPHYRDTLPAVIAANRQWEWVGHSHPRARKTLLPWWQQTGVPTVAEWGDVRAAVYVCDNSSTMYEAAALGMRVVALNAPWWRRDVHHGLRFWDPPGPMIDNAHQLPDAIHQALDAPPADLSGVYSVPRGEATAAAVRAIVHHCERLAA